MTAEALTLSTVDNPVEVLAHLTFLLAEEASAGEFGAVEGYVRALPEGERKALLVRAVEDARTVRDILARRAQRERETQALYETARDLTSLRDVDEVLSAIVDRVRRLLATDSTYIALIDDDTGDAYMRVTSGTVTAPIRSVRQRPGSGVGGRVIATGRPFATTNYLTDPRIHRETQVASAVGEDGVVSIAGVPMKLGQRVIGALFAADRHERIFDQHDIALLTSLAHHASVVIDNARLFGQVGITTEELREAHAQLSAQRHALELAATAHELLMPLALAGADLGEVADTMARLLDGTVALETATDRVAATAPGGVPVEAVFRTGIVVPLRAGGETHGRLYFGRTEPLTETELGTLERAAQTATLLVLLERQTATVEQDLRHELVEDLLGEREPDWDSVHRRAKRFTVLVENEPHVVVVVSGDVPELTAAAECAASRRGGLASEVDGQVVLILPGCDAGAIARAVVAELDSGAAGVTAGGGAHLPADTSAHQTTSADTHVTTGSGMHPTASPRTDATARSGTHLKPSANANETTGTRAYPTANIGTRVTAHSSTDPTSGIGTPLPAGAGAHPHASADTQPTAGTNTRVTPRGSTDPMPNVGTQTTTGTNTQPSTRAGENVTARSGAHPTPSVGTNVTPGTSADPTANVGTRVTAGSSAHPTSGMGTRPPAGAGARSTAADGISKRETTGTGAHLAVGASTGTSAHPTASAHPTPNTGTQVTAGAAGPAHDLRALRAIHRQAQRCHRLLLALGRAGGGAGLDELGVVGVVLDNVGPEQLRRVVRRALGPLVDYDAEHRSALLATVECYFDRGQSPPAAARALGIHVNTLYQRLDRIDHVLGDAAWRDPENTLDLQVALQLYRLMPSPAAPGRGARTSAPSPSTSSAAHRTPPTSAP
ncbi:GAF domain-containing protein [Amycolatopsis rhabdoformis]|uniref:GAF domain-containing protein n=1 Tax=Amycolatopsis rhabdoformis TaxID=1448059 RepID=A0ABZ1I2B8_9PSEU|nr:GAF domain-containing protein [Amycolatopsis rhabdoformis]WSE27963.1 GAF domain-containing protein [Amycolatopsis rhabdoformis]